MNSKEYENDENGGAASHEITDNDSQQAEEGQSSPSLPLQQIDISLLPPLPEPRYDRKRREAVGGSCFVFFLILIFVGMTHGIALEALEDGFEYHGTIWWVFFALIYSQSLAALLCLFVLLVADPGVVKRSHNTCQPIPAQMVPSIRDYLKHQSSSHKQFVRPSEAYYTAENGTGDTYCVRCLVWRRDDDGRHYHCSTCQRCVKKYDHHCSVFGRCIAGKMTGGGNYKYFVMICSCFAAALLTSFIALVWSLSIVFGPQWVVPIASGLMIYIVVSSRVCLIVPQFLRIS
jgi:hypothetical protein